MPSPGMNTQTNAIPCDDRLLTEKETAEYLRIKVRQLYNWRVSGLIPFIRIGKALRYRKSAIDQVLARQTMGPS
jgi:excisionase family DNA binding protein